MRALLLCTLMSVVVGAALFACNPNSIGRPCVNPGGQAVIGAQVASPALECPSRLCLIEQAGASTGNSTGASDGGFRATCTAGCQTDSDCDPETKASCPSGFVCAVATTVGPFCCRKLCLCKDDLSPNNSDSDGGVKTPELCKPGTNPECKNVASK
jgi:hypothetical protein